MNRDPLTEGAEKVATNALTHNVGAKWYTKVNGAELYVRAEISAFASPRTQREFIQVLRVAMLNHMEAHRLTCKTVPCRREDLYEELKFVLLDELDALTPQGIYTEDLSSAQINRMEEIKAELLEAINGGNERALEAGLVLLGAIEEGFDEILKDRATKASNTSAMIRRYVAKYGERAGMNVLDRVIEEITKTLN